MNKYLAISLMIVSLLIGIALGFSQTPAYTAMAQGTDSMDLGPVDKQLDLRYIDGMIKHHQAAIYLAKQVEDRSHRKEIRELGKTIITADEQGISDLYALKKTLYGNTQQVETSNKINLGQVDDNFDLRFLNALIDHHKDAIAVAQELRGKSTRTETLNIADTVITSLTSSLATLQSWRKEWYAI